MSVGKVGTLAKVSKLLSYAVVPCFLPFLDGRGMLSTRGFWFTVGNSVCGLGTRPSALGSLGQVFYIESL